MRYELVAAIAGVLSATLICMASDEMELAKVHVDSFTVAGIETRTSNEQEMTGNGAIPRMWARLKEENLLGKIPHRVDDHVVALYTDYESDKDGPYTYLLGAKVSSPKDVPEGMVTRTVPAGSYAMFTAQGASPAVTVVNLWKRIWSLEKPGQLHRAYKTDFEVYPQAVPSGSTENRVEVYVGVREKR